MAATESTSSVRHLINSVFGKLIFLSLFILTGCAMSKIDEPVQSHIPTHQHAFVLQNAFLDVHLVTPSHPAGGVDAVRFDQTARVTNLKYKGIELLDERGMPDEFGLLGIGVLGYEDGDDTFVKLGVGQLKRNKPQQYHFGTAYPLQALADTRIEFVGPHEIQLVQTFNHVSKYSYVYRKKISIDPQASVLKFDYALENHGQDEMTFDTYNHNFFKMGEGAIGSRLHFNPGFIPAYLSTDRLLLDEQGVSFSRDLLAPQTIFLPFLGNEKPFADAAILTDRYAGIKASIKHVPSPLHFTFFADSKAIAPEYFIRLTVKPQDAVTWQRTYTFESVSPVIP
tara:strand:- start:106056 stop:107072 length:1017 start_codon:yes stop_codon:yes gene_type:complete